MTIQSKQIIGGRLRQLSILGTLLGMIQPKQVVPPDYTSLPAAAIGVYSTSAKRLTATSAGPDLVAGTSIVITWQMYGVQPADLTTPFSATETILSNCTNTTGWELRTLSNANLQLVIITGSANQVTWPRNVVPGLNRAVLTVTGGGAIRASLNGGDAFELVAAGFSYSNAGVSAQYVIGGINTARVAAGQPLVDGDVLSVVVIPSTLSDSDLIAVSGQINQLERYQLGSTITGASPTSAWQATDWDGSSGTTTAGIGSSPTTWTVAGSPTKKTIEAEYVYNAQNLWFADKGTPTVVTYQNGSGTYNLRTGCARMTFLSSNPSKIVIDAAADTSPTQRTGLRVNGVPQGIGLWINEQGFLRSCDWMAGSFDSGQSTFELIDDINRKITAHATTRGCSIQRIRVPVSSPIYQITTDVNAPSVRYVAMGDSIIGNAGATATLTHGWSTFMRANMKALGIGQVSIDAIGGSQWYDNAIDASAITASLTRLTSQLDGTSTNILIISLGTNDYGSASWTAAAFQTGVGNWFDAFHAAFPSVTVILVTPLVRSVESANAVGSTLPDYRTALANVQSTRSSYVTLVDGTTLMTSPLLGSDGVHPADTSGHVRIEFLMARTLGYVPPYPWNDSTLLPPGDTTFAFIADSGKVDASSVGTWTADKGGVNATQGTAANKPTFSNTSWASSPAVGGITADGVNDILVANGLAGALSGDDTPFCVVVAVQPVTVAAAKVWLALSHSTTATKGFDNFNQAASSHVASGRTDDAGTSSNLSTTQTYDTSRAVYSKREQNGLTTIRKNCFNTSVNGSAQNVGTCTFDRFSIFGTMAGDVAASFVNARIRGIVGRGDGGIMALNTSQCLEGHFSAELV